LSEPLLVVAARHAHCVSAQGIWAKPHLRYLFNDPLTVPEKSPVARGFFRPCAGIARVARRPARAKPRGGALRLSLDVLSAPRQGASYAHSAGRAGVPRRKPAGGCSESLRPAGARRTARTSGPRPFSGSPLA